MNQSTKAFKKAHKKAKSKTKEKEGKDQKGKLTLSEGSTLAGGGRRWWW